jgi:hypothetical protein
MSRALTRYQHLDPYRKVLLRKKLLKWAIDGPAYVPFIGDGDLAAGMDLRDAPPESGAPKSLAVYPGLYLNRYVYGADLDANRVALAQSRIPNGMIRCADCDTWPFDDVQTAPFAVADFDAWAEPWPSFRNFWNQADKADRVVLFFTDAHRMGIMVDGTHIHPDGSNTKIDNLTERRQGFNFYLSKHVWPWFEDYIRPYRMIYKMRYLRGMLTYWGCVLEKKS